MGHKDGDPGVCIGDSEGGVIRLAVGLVLEGKDKDHDDHKRLDHGGGSSQGNVVWLGIV